MRIIAGANRGLALTPVGQGDPAAHLRPTSDRVRESLFNVLTGGRHGDPVTEARVLDLFAGTGALALEALSRGAARATLVDDGRTATRLIAANIALCRASDRTRLLRTDATRLPPCDGLPATLVFLDPPYGRGLGAQALTAALAGGWIAPGATVVWEEASPQNPPAGLTLTDQRRWGDTWVGFLAA
jgi:16S rRNA (guanine966-N2)-methyltransferase